MKRNWLKLAGFGLAATLWVPAAMAQDDGLNLQKRRIAAAAVANSPVTAAEVADAAAKLERAMKGVIPAFRAPRPMPLTGSRPATREEVLRQYRRLFDAARPHFRLKPAPTRFDPAMFTVTDPATRESLTLLVRWGFVSRQGVLASSDKPTLSLREFGDTMGFFIARLAEVTHIPSTRWSPYLQRNDAG